MRASAISEQILWTRTHASCVLPHCATIDIHPVPYVSKSPSEEVRGNGHQTVVVAD